MVVDDDRGRCSCGTLLQLGMCYRCDRRCSRCRYKRGAHVLVDMGGERREVCPSIFFAELPDPEKVTGG